MLIAVTTGMRMSEIFGRTRSDVTRRRSLRTGEDLRPFEYQNDGTLCEAGEATYRSNQRHSTRTLEDPSTTVRERRERWLTNVRVLFARGKLNVFGYL